MLNGKLSNVLGLLKKEPESLVLLRHQLASIDLSDIKEEEMSENERKEYNSAVSAVWPRLKKDIEKFIYDQLLFASNNTSNWEQLLMARGTINGFFLLEEKWKQAHIEHEAGGMPKEKFDKSSPVPEL